MIFSAGAVPFILAAFLLIAAIGLLFLWKLTGQLREERKLLKRRVSELEMKEPVSDKLRLEGKLDSHLLRNALNAIQSHAYQSYYALDKLSNVLDYVLYESDESYVRLDRELHFALSLIEVNRIKTSPLFDLHIRNNINDDDAAYQQLMIAPFITINPIENAFKHADIQSENAFISITFDLHKDWLKLSVSNKLNQEKPVRLSGSGFGNPVFRDKLNLIYPERHRLTEEERDGVYHSRLEIRLHAAN